MNSSSTGEKAPQNFTLTGEAGSAGFAHRLAVSLKGGMIIGLSGELGAGKTTITRLLVSELGGLTPVSSPTYVLQHEYATDRGVTIEHWDLYRLAGLPEELLGICPADRIRLIEWPERAPELLSMLDLHLLIGFPESAEAPDVRVVTIEKGLIPDV